jgi:glycerol-3-phosphate dehydrogenase
MGPAAPTYDAIVIGGGPNGRFVARADRTASVGKS